MTAVALTGLAARLLDTTFDLVATPSVSGEEERLLDEVAERLAAHPHLAVTRGPGGAVVADGGPASPPHAPGGGLPGGDRLLLVGHVDTVPPTLPPQPVTREGGTVRGRGAVDMKGGVAVLLELAGTVFPRASGPCRLVLYGREELGSHQSGLRVLADARPDLLQAAAAVVAEPTGGWLELGCQGNLRVRATFEGVAAHTARPWQGRNAVRVAGPALQRCLAHRPEEVEVDGLRFPQAFEVVRVVAGGFGNVLPERCEVEVNVRYAPGRDRARVLDEVRGLLEGASGVEVTLDSPAAPPPTATPLLAPLVADPAVPRRGKLGWTEVGRLAALGVPAVNFGPGDPELAHGPREAVGADELLGCYLRLEGLLTAPRATLA